MKFPIKNSWVYPYFSTPTAVPVPDQYA